MFILSVQALAPRRAPAKRQLRARPRRPAPRPRRTAAASIRSTSGWRPSGRRARRGPLGRALGACDAAGDLGHGLAGRRGQRAGSDQRLRPRPSRPARDRGRASPRPGQCGGEARDIGRPRAATAPIAANSLSSSHQGAKPSDGHQRADRSRAALHPSSRCRARSRPRRCATGRLGMTRTIARASGKALAQALSASTPASIETRMVSGPTCGASPGATSSSFCGLKPSMTNRGALVAG